MVKVAVNIVTFNSAREIAACLDSLQKQTFQNIGIHIFDNASSDDTLKVVSSFDIDYLKHSPVNTGFCRAHNDLVRCFPSEYVLFLNPDTILQSVFIEELVRALDARPDAASASGKLLRLDGKTLDSTGIIMLREQRHLDRGADQIDEGQFERAEDIFGPSGAAALFRRTALDDVAIGDQYFDEFAGLEFDLRTQRDCAASPLGHAGAARPTAEGNQLPLRQEPLSSSNQQYVWEYVLAALLVDNQTRCGCRWLRPAARAFLDSRTVVSGAQFPKASGQAPGDPKPPPNPSSRTGEMVPVTVSTVIDRRYSGNCA
ncbi:MAG: hypothetical protein DMG11_10000 [Acidobacteria bacterium]|nr:MAG: hypothetical protein DMG11_10000 [Acidobacteriota bacterium]